MIELVRGASGRSRFGLIALISILVLFALLLFAPPDGNERAQLWQFVGRFHPLSVHLPIALLIIVPLFEFAGRNRFSYLLPAVDFLLGLAVCAAIAAAYLGWSLGRSGAYSGPLITQHMWGGAFVACAAWACWFLREHPNPQVRRSYLFVLVASVALVSFTGYRGGQLSQGEAHLTEFMPEPLAGILGVGASGDPPANSPNGGPNTFYGARVQPVFSRQCVTCHGRSKHKSNLRLDSYEAALRGGKHGAVIKAGDPKTSELFHRITLPSSDDDFMPADKKRPVSAADVKLIEMWIASGASGTIAADAIKDVPTTSTPVVAEVTFKEIDLDAVAKERGSLAQQVAEIQKRFPNVLDYESRGSADLVVNAAWMGPKFGDAELAALAPVNERIVLADFSSTGITDKSANAIAAMKHVRTLRLMHTKISDSTLQAIRSLDQLETVSLFGTNITPTGLANLTQLHKLQRIYAGGQKVAATSPVPAELKDMLVF